MSSRFSARYLQRLAGLDGRNPLVVQTRLKLLEDVGLERFQHLGPGVRFKPAAVPGGKLAGRLKAIQSLPPAQQETAKIAYLAHTRFGQALLPPVYDKQREYGTLLNALNWLGVERFKRLAEDDFDLATIPDLQRDHPDRQVIHVRSAPLPAEEQQRAVAQILKGTALGQHVLEFGGAPAPAAEAWEEAILAYIGGPERFLEVYRQPAFDVHTLPGIYDRPFAVLVAKVQKLGLSSEDEERAYVALLSYSGVGKRLLDGAGLPQPPRTVRGRPLRSEKMRSGSAPRPLKAHVELLEHIGRERFLELVKEPLFDLEAIDGWEHTGTALPSRRRLIEQSALTPEEKERALVALLAINPTPFVHEHELYRAIIRRTPQYRRGKFGRASEYFFPKLLAEVGASRFVRLAREPLYDLSGILTAKDTGKWGLNRKFERVRWSDLSDEEKEKAFVSILARSRVGKRYLEEAAGAHVKSHTPKLPAPAMSTGDSAPTTPGEPMTKAGSGGAGPPPPPVTAVKSGTTSSGVVARFAAVVRTPFAGCDTGILALASAAALPLRANPSTVIQVAASLGLLAQATMPGV